MRKSLKNKMLINISAAFIAVMLIVTILLLIVISRQNRKVAQSLFQNTFNIVRYTISEKQKKLLLDSAQMTTQNDMSGMVNYVATNQRYFKYSIMRPTYLKIAGSLYNTGVTSDIYQSAIYGMDGKLIAFSVISGKGSTVGYLHSEDILETAQIEPDKELTYEAWTQQSCLPAGIPSHLVGIIPDESQAVFEIINHSLCIIAQTPVIGKDYNSGTDKMEPRQVGVLVTIQKLDTAFVNEMSELSGTQINIFDADGLMAGTYPSYTVFDINVAEECPFDDSLCQHLHFLKDIKLSQDSFYRAVMPIYTNSKRIAAIVSLHSKHDANAYTARIIKMMSAVYFVGLLLIAPIVIIMIVQGVIKPIEKIASVIRSITRTKDFNQTLNVESQDEIGELAKTFNQMIEDLSRTTTSVDNLNKEVAERKEAEEKLKKERNFSRSIIETAQAIMLVLDTEGKIVSFNPYIEQLCSYHLDEVKGKDWFEFFLPQRDRERMRKLFKNAINNIQTRGNINPIITKDGREIEIEWYDKTLKDENGNITGLLSIGQDITERKKVEEQLRESEEKYRTQFEGAIDAIFLANCKTGILVDCNQAALKLVGRQKSEIIGQHQAILHPSESLNGRFSRTFKSHAEGKEDAVMEENVITRDGQIKDVAIKANILEIGGDKVVQGIFRDITEDKQKEKELRKTQVELIEASRRAGMTEVATDVLHNVGNVLNSINVSATLINDALTNSEAPNLKKVADMIEEHQQDLNTFFTLDPKGRYVPSYLIKAGKLLANEQEDVMGKLGSLVEDVNHIKTIIRMQQEYAKVSGVEVVTTIDKIIEDAIRINQAGLTRHKIQIVRDYADLGEVTLDKHRVVQILVNLIGNAKYAIAESERPERVLKIRSYQQGENHLRVEVVDNGIGISKENLTKVFRHGFTTKKDGHGFGLHSGALAAKEMNGSLTAYSNGLGHGAIFTLELPFKPVGAMQWKN